MPLQPPRCKPSRSPKSSRGVNRRERQFNQLNDISLQARFENRSRSIGCIFFTPLPLAVHALQHSVFMQHCHRKLAGWWACTVRSREGCVLSLLALLSPSFDPLAAPGTPSQDPRELLQFCLLLLLCVCVCACLRVATGEALVPPVSSRHDCPISHSPTGNDRLPTGDTTTQ